MLVRMSFTIMMAIFGVGFICYFMFGSASEPPLYVIDVQRLAGVTPKTAEQLLNKMVPCKLMVEHRWEVRGDVDVQEIGKLFDVNPCKITKDLSQQKDAMKLLGRNAFD